MLGLIRMIFNFFFKNSNSNSSGNAKPNRGKEKKGTYVTTDEKDHNLRWKS